MARTAELSRRPLAAAALVSLLSHAILAACWLGGTAPTGDQMQDRVISSPLSLRLLQLTDRAPATADLAGAVEMPAPAGEPAALAAPAVPPTDTRLAHDSSWLSRTVDQPPHEATAVPALVPVSPDPKRANLASSLPAAAVVDGYVLRSALTVPPQPRGEVKLTWPAGWFSDGRHTGVFSLFIDEQGTVRRMVIDGPTLSPLLEQTARETFMATRFDPGQVDGRPVKALIRIEVVFSDPTPASRGPVVVSRQNL